MSSSTPSTYQVANSALMRQMAGYSIHAPGCPYHTFNFWQPENPTNPVHHVSVSLLNSSCTLTERSVAEDLPDTNQPLNDSYDTGAGRRLADLLYSLLQLLQRAIQLQQLRHLQALRQLLNLCHQLGEVRLVRIGCHCQEKWDAEGFDAV